MSIFIECPQCRTRFRCKDQLAGEQVCCLKCQAILYVSKTSTADKQPGQNSLQTEATCPAADSREVPWIPPQWDSGLMNQLIESGESATCKQVSQPKAAYHFREGVATSSMPSGQLLLLITGILFMGALLTFLLYRFIGS